jgi:hypothetical protein
VPPFGSNRSELDLLAGSFNAMARHYRHDRELRIAEERLQGGSRARRDARTWTLRNRSSARCCPNPLAVGCVRYAPLRPADSVGGDYFGYFRAWRQWC